MEDLGRLFDSCDSSYAGRVPVSKLIQSVTKEVNTFNNNDHQQQEKEDILMAVRYLLDPTDQDNLVDKATWMAAWRKQAETPSPKKSNVYDILDLAGGDADTSADCQGLLDVSKHSYCFSPGSRSSLEESEEVTQLREENAQLQTSLKIVKQQLQKLDEALLQEQIEKQELEKLKDCELNKLTKQIKSLTDSKQELKCSLEVCEREKLDLCKSYDSLHVTDRQLRLQLAEQKRVVAALSSDIEDFNQEKENLQLHLLELEGKLQQQANVHQEQLLEFRKTILNYQEEKDELNSQIANTMLEKRQLSACWDELDCSITNNNLQAELSSLNFESPSFATDPPTPLETSLLLEMQAVRLHAETQTQGVFRTPPKTTDKCNQAEIKLSPVKTVAPLTCHAETQTQLNLNDTSLKGVDICIQAEVQMCLAETQTTPVTPKKSVDKCNQVELLMCPIETQTSLEASGSNKLPILSNDYTDQSYRKPLLRCSSRKKPSDLILDKILSMQRENEETVLPTVQTCHAETQTQFILNGTSPKGVDKCSQAEVEMCLAETQTGSVTPQKTADKCNQVELLMCPVETQTSPVASRPSPSRGAIPKGPLDNLFQTYQAKTQTKLNLNIEAPLCVDKCNQAEVEMCSAETQTNTDTFERYHLCLSIFLRKHFFQNLSSAERIVSPSPDLSLRITDEQSSVQNEHLSVLSPKSQINYLWAASTCIIFLILLIISTIFCTGAVLQIASESGLLSFPYLGQTPEFMKTVMTPFVRINVRRPVVENVPV